MRLDIRCVTVYAFSIENFKRSPTEVDTLMDLAKTKLAELCENGCVFFFFFFASCSDLHVTHSRCRDLLEQYGIRLNVLGKVSLFPEDVQAVVRRAEELTKRNSTCVRSLSTYSIPFTSRFFSALSSTSACPTLLATKWRAPCMPPWRKPLP